MRGYVVRRVLLLVPTLWGVATVSFLLLRLLPGDPAKLMAGVEATPQQVEQLRQQLGLTGSEWSQYWHFIGNLLHGDLGTSATTGNPVMQEILSRAGYTVLLAVAAITVALIIGCGLGTLAALRRGRFLDVAASGISVFGVSMPTYWVGLLLIVVFAVNLHWLPAAGAAGPSSIVLPTLTLAPFAIGFISRQTRSAMVEALGQDYVRTARAKGLAPASVVLKHALRNAAVPIITVAGLQFGQLLGGAILTESIFGWPGIGRLLVDSISSRDYATVQGTVFVFAIAVMIVNLLTDLAYAAIDPRVRYGHQ